ncbi:unnamed protein product [Cylindrotheca closterium]|uniref:Uncharacterized protein n=1 Tax=Cylindrotheca closterium TaxID=2856 RepID=A0AAD2CCE0_9STRA|nr:unnamed protein product [Cylindrotheca closterium]
MMADYPTEDNLVRARDLYMNNVEAATAYSYKQAMTDAGIPEAVASQPFYQHNVKTKVLNETSGNPQIDMRMESKRKRFQTLYRLLYEGILLRKRSNYPDTAGTMRKAGYAETEIYKFTTPKKAISKHYAYCARAAKRIRDNVDVNLTIKANTQHAHVPENIVEEVDDEEMSPVSAASSEDPHFPFSPDRNNDYHELVPLPEATKLASKRDDASVRSTASTISSITTQSAPKRKTPAQKQHERKSEAQLKMMRSCAYKVGTYLYSLKDQNPCVEFQDESHCADQVNRLFGIEVISGRDLREAVKQKRVGQSPPRVGRPSLIPDEDFIALCDAFWSMNAIDQNNVDGNRLNRPKEITLLDDVVNEKRKKDGDIAIGAEKLKLRIDAHNAPRQDIEVLDPRRQLRVEWLTTKNQMDHYKNSEKMFLERGYARSPKNDQERAEGYIVFHPGQEKRNINMDEMKFTLDASVESLGGRPAHSHTTSCISEGGKADKTPDTACTVVMAVNDDEPLPPMVIFKSTAKDGCGYINARNLRSFPQIKGKWGYEKPRIVDCLVSTGANASMNTDILQNWMRESILTLYPDCQDIPGRRVCLKVDSGPGRTAAKFVGETRVEGVDIFPGLPNGSECNQEMDQLFSPYKNSVYRNRDKLANAKGNKGNLTLVDVGYCLFGGQVTLEDGNVLELEESFVLHFTPEKIRAAREKCGYCPATRRALEDPKVRHEIVEVEEDNTLDELNEVDDGEDASEEPSMMDELNEVDDDEDVSERPKTTEAINDGEAQELTSMTKVLLKVEKTNHRAVDDLILLGYTHANKLRRAVRRFTRRTFGKGIETAPGSRERQELFARLQHAGDYFRITKGGGVYNIADVLIGLEIKGMKQQVEIESKRKKKLQSFYSIRQRATKLVHSKHYTKWTKADFATVISYKRGPFHKCEKEEPTISVLKRLELSELRKHYEENYKGKSSAWRRQDIWSVKDEEELKRLKSGEVSHYTETRIYGDALETQNAWLQKKFESISKDRQIQVLSDILKNLDEGVIDSVVNSLPYDKSTLLHDCLNRAPSSDDDEDLNNSSSIHFCETDLEFASQWNDDDTLVENEMTEAEMECAAILEEEYHEDQNVGEEENADEDFDSDDSIADDNHDIIKDIEIDATPADGDGSMAAASSDDSSCASAGSFEMQDNAMSDNEEKSMDGIGRQPPREPTVSPSNAGVSEIQTSPTRNERAVEESVENASNTDVEAAIADIETSKDAQTKIALYNLLIKSRGKKVGRRKKKEALERYWKELKTEPLVWSVDDLKSELDELAHSC